MSYTNPPSLPLMSSLLSRQDNIRPEQQQQQKQKQASYNSESHAYAPEYPDRNHPLYLSEMNPSAPVQHIYRSQYGDVHVSQYRAEPLSVPIKPSSRLLARRDRVPLGPNGQRRVFSKISQRRDDLEEHDVEINRSSAAGQGRANDPDRSRSRPQKTSHFAQRKKDSETSEPPKQQETTPRGAQPTSVPISGLLSAELTASSSSVQRPTLKYSMTVRQQPLAARACGFGERDRRVIDPPPILQLVIEDPTSTPDEISARLRQPYLVVHCTLWDPATDEDASAMPGSPDRRQQRRLMGTLVSSPFVGKDEFNVEGCFFTFPDLSVRTPGTYSLKFKLVVIDPTKMSPGSRSPISATIKSAPFNVFIAKDFQGMRASTELTKRLKHQGCLISVKKGKSRSSNAKDEEDDDDEEEKDNKGPAAKRNKRT